MKNDGCTVPRSRSQNAESVISRLMALDLQPKPTSRLMRMYLALTGSKKIIAPVDPEFEAVLEAERDFQVLAFVLDQEAAHPEDAGFRQLLRTALKDSLLPSEDLAHSKGRDAQFELFVAAICQNAGLQPVALEEPDVTCHIDGEKFGIAAKRVKSISSLETRVREAARQVEEARLRGIIAVDTNVALNRANERITAPIQDEQFALLYKQALEHFIGDFHEPMQQWVRGKGVRGIVIHDQQVRLRPDGEWSLVGMTVTVNTARVNQCRNREFAMFEQQYRRGLPNVVNLS